MVKAGPKIYFARSARPITAEVEHNYLTLLSFQMRLPVLRYRRWQDKQTSLFGKLLLLRALRLDYPHTYMEKLCSLELTRYNKPFLPTGPEFSISHSDEMVALAVSEEGAIGIDLERIRPIDLDDYSRVLPEVVGLSEKCGANQASALFFNYWTRKEAVLKACGEGLSVDLKQVVLQDDVAVFRGKTWYVRELEVSEGYCCHVATERPLSEVAIEEVDLMEGG